MLFCLVKYLILYFEFCAFWVLFFVFMHGFFCLFLFSVCRKVSCDSGEFQTYSKTCFHDKTGLCNITTQSPVRAKVLSHVRFIQFMSLSRNCHSFLCDPTPAVFNLDLIRTMSCLGATLQRTVFTFTYGALYFSFLKSSTNNSETLFTVPSTLVWFKTTERL